MSEFGIAGAGLVTTGMTIAANAASADKQRAHDYFMWREQNKYNSPKNQVDRLRSAGLNPHMALTNGAVASGISNQSAGGQQYPTYDFSPMAEGFSRAMELGLQKRSVDADARLKESQGQNQDIRNLYENNRQILELDKLANDASLTRSQRTWYKRQSELLRKQSQVFFDRNQAEMYLLNQQARKEEHEANKAMYEESVAKVIADYEPQKQKQLLANLRAEEDNLLSAAYANNQQGLKAAAEKVVIGLDEQQKRKLMPILIDEANAKADEAYWNAQKAGKDYHQGYVGRLFGSNYDPRSGEGTTYQRNTRKVSVDSRKSSPKKQNGGVR